MRFRSMLTLTAGVAVLGGSVLVACQNYEFDKVTPKAIGTVKQPTPIAGVQKPPKIMLVIDKSTSMKTLPEKDTEYGCCESVSGGSCVGYSTNPAAVCKWNSVKSLMNGAGKFLDSTAGGARIGLAVFPHKDAPPSDACMQGSILVEVPTNAGDTVSDIKAALNSITPSGGTPTAPMLKLVEENKPFVSDEPATKRYVVLITDGLPNCNKAPQTCTDCTNGAVPPMCNAPVNCVDETPVISAVQTLKSKGVETFVIGFGDLGTGNPVPLRVLNAAADAGGRPSGDPATRFYQATSDADLEKVLDKIKALIQQCTFTLTEAPSAEGMLEVTVAEKDGDPAIALERCTGSNTATCNWEYVDKTVRDSIRINDTKADKAPNGWCSQLQNSTPNTYTLNFMIVKELK